MTAPAFAGPQERSTALVRAFGPLLSRASIADLVAAGAVGLVLGAAWPARASLPTEAGAFRFFDLFLGMLVGPLVIGLVAVPFGLLVARAVMATRVLRAYEAFSWLGRAEVDRFETVTGSRVPKQPSEIERWLTGHPPTPALRLPRAELLAFRGRFAEARAELDASVADAPDQAYERASMRQYIAWLETGRVEIDSLRAAVGALPATSDVRLYGEVTIATALAMGRFMAGDAEWFAPLEAIRQRLGARPRRVIGRDLWLRLAFTPFAAGFVGAVVASLSRPLG